MRNNNANSNVDPNKTMLVNFRMLKRELDALDKIIPSGTTRADFLRSLCADKVVQCCGKQVIDNPKNIELLKSERIKMIKREDALFKTLENNKVGRNSAFKHILLFTIRKFDTDANLSRNAEQALKELQTYKPTRSDCEQYSHLGYGNFGSDLETFIEYFETLLERRKLHEQLVDLRSKQAELN